MAKKKLRPIGKSKGIILPAEFLEQMNVSNDEIDMRFDGSNIIISKYFSSENTAQEFNLNINVRVFKPP